MNKSTSRLFSVLVAAIGLLASPASADLGLAKMLANPSQGTPAVEKAILAAVQAAYAGTTNASVLQVQLIAILNEVAATGNEPAIRYAIVAVMGVSGGGAGNIEVSKDAINNSRVAAEYGELSATTIAEAEGLTRAAAGGRGGQSGGQSGGGNSVPVVEGIYNDINGGAKGQPGSGATRT